MIDKYQVSDKHDIAACAYSAIDGNWPEILTILAERDFDFTKPTANQDQPLPLLYSCHNDRLECFKVMVKSQKQFDVDMVCNNDRTILEEALKNHASDITELLIKLGADTSNDKQEVASFLAGDWFFEEG